MHRTLILKRPFPESLCMHAYELRLVIVRDCNAVRRRYDSNKGAKATCPIRGYYCHGRFLVESKQVVDGEICLAATAFEPGVIAHESYHAAMDAKRCGYLYSEADGWEETIAHCTERLTGIIWRRGQAHARALLA